MKQGPPSDVEAADGAAMPSTGLALGVSGLCHCAHARLIQRRVVDTARQTSLSQAEQIELVFAASRWPLC